MDISNDLRGAFLKAEDIERSGNINAIVSAVRRIELAGEPRLALDTDAGSVVLNKTNLSTLAADWGAETDDWTGRSVSICREVCNFQGKRTPCIRLYAAADAVPEIRPAVTAKREVRPLPRGTPTAGARRQPPSDSDMPF